MAQDALAQRLLETGAATRDEITRAQQGAGEAEVRLLTLAWERERKLCEALARAEQHPALVLSLSTIDLATADLIPERISQSHLLLPVAADAESLTLAVSSCDLGHVLDQIAFAAGRRVALLLAEKELLRAQIPIAYAARRRGEAVLVGPGSRSPTPWLETVRFVDEAKEAGLSQLMAGLSGSLSMLRGAAAVKSKPARGPAPVELAVPVLPVEPRSEAPAPAPAPSSGPHALVVEDDEGIRSLVARVLEGDGWEVAEAASGTEAIRHLQRRKPALVVLDAMVPGMHGFEVCARLKSSAYRDVPVIMMSAVYRGWEQAREIQERHGADAFLEKPFNVQLLRRMAANYLGREPEPASLSEERREVVGEHRRRAEAHLAARRWDEAIAELRLALDIFPFDATGCVRLGNALSQKGELDAAMRAYEAAVVYDPRSFSAAVNLASTYDRLGFRRKSVETWRKARALAHDEAAREMIDARLARG